MYRLVIYLFVPMINALLSVQIHRQTFYRPNSSCASLKNITLANDSSIQTCIWKCDYEHDCQTAVYFHDKKICSLFADLCTTGHIESNGNDRSSVICYRKNHEPLITCSSTSTVAPDVPTSNIETTVPVTPPPTHVFWSFDSNYNDLYNVYNGFSMSNCNFSSPGYTGYGSALSLKATYSQYVRVPTFLNMTYRSFTWELWAYPTSLANAENTMIGMCDAQSNDKCLHLIIRQSSALFGFWSDDCHSSTIVNINQWHHFAFVYDYTNRTQSIYLNGILVCKDVSKGPFLGNSGAISIGALKSQGNMNSDWHWTGYIDQVSYISRAKTTNEILTDATLVAYYSFDSGSFHDSGPNKINGTGVNISSVAGRINEGILFNASQAYFQANGFTLIGTSYRSYSIALWIYKSSPAVGYGTVVHLSVGSTGVGNWCIPIIGLTSSYHVVGQSWNYSFISVIGPILPLEMWTHVVTSYSDTNGIRLWINGTLINSSGQFIYVPSGVPMIITLGSSLNGTSGCGAGSIQKGQFYGMMDELRIYSRELNASDIYTLANP